MAKILVVDDDPRNLRVLLTVLEQTGHEVLSADSGAAGLEAALACAPDLVFMDVQMPDMDGTQVLKRLRAEPRTAALKVIAVTGLAMKGDAEWLLAEGFDSYLGKPIRYKVLLALVETMLGGAQPGAVFGAKQGDE